MVSYNIIPKKRNRFRLSTNITLIIVNVVAFIAFDIWLYLNPNAIDFIALKPASILQGKYLWTFLTSMFMHAGFLHIFVNMLSLFFVGSLVEKILGPKRYLITYLSAGLFAGLFFVLSGLIFPSALNAYAVGASGAIFGLVGLLMFMTPNLPVYIMFIPIPIKMKYAAPGMLIALWLVSIAPLVVGGQQIPIGNTAHLGGFLLGLGFGAYFRVRYKKKTKMISKYFS